MEIKGQNTQTGKCGGKIAGAPNISMTAKAGCLNGRFKGIFLAPAPKTFP